MTRHHPPTGGRLWRSWLAHLALTCTTTVCYDINRAQQKLVLCSLRAWRPWCKGKVCIPVQPEVMRDVSRRVGCLLSLDEEARCSLCARGCNDCFSRARGEAKILPWYFESTVSHACWHPQYTVWAPRGCRIINPRQIEVLAYCSDSRVMTIDSSWYYLFL